MCGWGDLQIEFTVKNLGHMSISRAIKMKIEITQDQQTTCNGIAEFQKYRQLFNKQGIGKCILGIILRAPRAEHTSPLLRPLHWLPVQKRIRHKVCSICYTTLTGARPKYMSEPVNVHTPSRCLRSSSDSRTLTIPFVRTKACGQRSFAYQGPATWNELPFDIRRKDSLSTFKSALKTHLFHHLI